MHRPPQHQNPQGKKEGESVPVTEIECCEVTEVHEDLLRAVTAKMPPEDVLADLAELFKVFGDFTRIRILYVLFESEVCVCDIAENCG